jgi:hypothetical protein
VVFDIVPSTGIKGLAFGARKADVRGHFGEGRREFRRSAAAGLSDHWPDVAVFAYYDDAETLEALEFAPPAVLRLAGQNLFALDWRRATEIVSDMDGAPTVEEDGLTCNRLGMSIWTDLPTSDAPPKSITVFRPGYYD